MQFNKNEDTSKSIIKIADDSRQNTVLILSKIEKFASECFGKIDHIVFELGNKILENNQYIKNSQREFNEEISQANKNQSVAFESFKEDYSKVMRVSKWTMALTIFNLLLVGGVLTFILVNLKF
ncbi:hypothetical protein [Candidatus Contendibacter odensensis]|uniref:Uncharacterized protein n=1 Tax=Candidatus Contendobacter odensis Run_B_J11 TaxID=1400861 RepID=A0A7U7GG67_9GAMM|nr:hypothetical protein [Candidatus Contendobacter odensis]CDH47582.1 hypothetical protein BN874_840045 [Candidatus Contendobacter odensis Run_B_J11]